MAACTCPLYPGRVEPRLPGGTLPDRCSSRLGGRHDLAHDVRDSARIHGAGGELSTWPAYLLWLLLTIDLADGRPAALARALPDGFGHLQPSVSVLEGWEVGRSVQVAPIKVAVNGMEE